MTAFRLDPQLEKDTIPLTNWPLSNLRLMNDRRYPWVIMVPQKPDLVELIDLQQEDRHLLMDEIADLCVLMNKAFKPKKLNVAALGNQVSQLHIHVIARYENDPAWPGPVWGIGDAIIYSESAVELIKEKLKVER